VDTQPLELSPARAAFSVAGRVGLLFDLSAMLAALSFVPRPGGALALFTFNTAVSGGISLAMWRRTLRRVEPSIPERAVVVCGRPATAQLVGSTLTTAVVFALSIVGVVSPAVLGAGAGAEIGRLWCARKIDDLERREGHQIVRALRRRPGQPSLYMVPVA